MQNQMLAEQCRAFVRAFKNAWHAEVGQNPRYSIVDYNDRDLLVRCASGQITGGHRMETDLFLIRRNMGVPVGYDRRVFLELKSGIHRCTERLVFPSNDRTQVRGGERSVSSYSL